MGSKKKRSKSKSSDESNKDVAETRSKQNVASAIEDPRFQAAETHPQFRSSARKQQKQGNELISTGGKVVIDERFAAILTDKERFGEVGSRSHDKYGRRRRRRKDKQGNGGEDMSAFYTVEGVETLKGNKRDDKDDRFSLSKLEKKGKKQEKDAHEAESSSDDNDADEGGKVNKDEFGLDPNETPASRIAYLNALSRGELDVSSSSSSDSDDDSSEDDGHDSDDDEEDDDQGKVLYGTVGILDPSSKGIMGAGEEDDVSLDNSPSPYLAVMGMDWEFVRAVDLFSIFSSFTAPGAVRNVRVYPSDFGMERMEQDRLTGPSGLWKKQKSAENERRTKTGVDDSGDRHSTSGDESNDSSSNNENGDDIDMTVGLTFENDQVESDYDVEKVRAYEASKLRYFFAVVTFSDPEHADVAYKQIDGMEFEHSSSKMDLRTIPPEELNGVITDRPLRDEAFSIPHNYEPPEFVVNALQQTNVECTWDMGDPNRQRALTKYSKTGWGTIKDSKDSDDDDSDDDIRAYIASDDSSSDESNKTGDGDDSDEDSDDDDSSHDGKKKAKKASNLRKMLGLDDDDDDDGRKQEIEAGDDEHDGDFNSSDDDALLRNLKRKSKVNNKAVTFIPGETKQLEEKIRSKLVASKNDPAGAEELTPWEKYQAKRKQKRMERRQAARGKKDDHESDSEVMSSKTKQKQRGKRRDDDEQVEDPFFSGELNDDGDDKKFRDREKANAELELLMAGNDEEERAKDYDIRGLQRLEKTKDKKLRGSSKRKRAKLESLLPGTDFKIDTKDRRFAAVLDGSDDKFGIDRTNPNYKATPAMKEILEEQTRRRKKRRKKKEPDASPGKIDVMKNVNVDVNEHSAGAAALSSLVMTIKSRIK